MTTAIIVVVVVALAVIVSQVLQRRSVDAPVSTGAIQAPIHLHRTDFSGEDRPWLVAVFTSASCDTCAETVARASVLSSTDVAVVDVEVTEHPDIHKRYGIEAVPIVAIADSSGEVVKSFIGPVSATHLWGAVAEAREPGSVPEDCGDASQEDRHD